ncbi:dihydroorotase [Aureimonas pseudogalii]|uniref:Allantoinase n=1 Tax=Aureimonas pseudogalii TaxID=1744844 RepID=A0A7W6H5R7_9HYPH|nr:amidohydrolase family protein [Aureimonas pseudogalii]MBB3999065.1 allantoinase [Aureimonas pseudogalii]
MDRLIINGLVVTEAGPVEADIGITGGKVSALFARGTAGAAAEVIEADGLIVMPGAIDMHTHFTGSHDQPVKELRDGTIGAAVGGVTTVVEMPHSAPPATSVQNFNRKRALLDASVAVDFALWAGLDGDNLDELAGLDAAGAIAFKAFLTSGDPAGDAPDEKGLPQIRDGFLLDAMREIERFDGLIGIHAENHDLLVAAKAKLLAAGRHDIRAHAEAGPEIAEIEAVGRVLALARESGVRCHVVHVSSAKAAVLISAAKLDVRASFETCPHYLVLDEEDLVRIGANARCGPPLRPRATVDALWAEVLAGKVDALASDHCPYLPAQKRSGDSSIWEAGMGLTGVETLGPIFFSEAVNKRGLGLGEFARMTASGPAKLMGLYPQKGAIRIGADADLALYDPAAEWIVSGVLFHGLAPWSAFEGLACCGRVVHTLVRGISVQIDGHRKVEPGFGQFVTRMRQN